MQFRGVFLWNSLPKHIRDDRLLFKPKSKIRNAGNIELGSLVCRCIGSGKYYLLALYTL